MKKELKLCKDCKNFKPRSKRFNMFGVCMRSSPKRQFSFLSVEYSERVELKLPRERKRWFFGCGKEARYFEPKIEGGS